MQRLRVYLTNIFTSGLDAVLRFPSRKAPLLQRRAGVGVDVQRYVVGAHTNVFHLVGDLAVVVPVHDGAGQRDARLVRNLCL